MGGPGAVSKAGRDKARFKAQATPSRGTMAKRWGRYPFNPCGTIKFDGVGHTGTTSGTRGNLQLSRDRAKAVSAYLQGKGVSG